MTYEEYWEKNKDKDHILIRMTDSFPFFKEKFIIENGKDRIDTNYHIADGLFSRYTNFELPNGALAAETSYTPIFESMYVEPERQCPIFITNIGEEAFEVSLRGIELPREYEAGTATGLIHPNEVLAIFPKEAALATVQQFEKESVIKYEGVTWLSQKEIERILRGYKDV